MIEPRFWRNSRLSCVVGSTIFRRKKKRVVEGDFFPAVMSISRVDSRSTLVTLEQKLARFDPELHGGEAMATVRVEEAP